MGSKPEEVRIDIKDAPDAKAKGKGKGKEKRDLRQDLPIVGHLFTLEQLAAEYNVSYEAGLTSKQVQEQREKWGENRLTPPVTIPAWLLYLNQYKNFFAILLIAGSILCFIAYGLDQSDQSNLYLGVVLFLVVFISSTFSYIQEAKANAIMEGFKNLVPKKCKAIRDGAATVLDASELVPGDLVEFQEGDQVPADIRVIAATNLKVDNSSLTGESDALERVPELVGGEHQGHGGKPTPAIEATNLLFFSTILTSGHGRGIVIGTGDNTVMGQIAGLATETKGDDKPPIAKEVDHFITIISGIAITIGVVFLSVGLGIGVMTVVQALVFAISVIVAVVPEGLLVTLTVALALTAKRMSHKNVLVKNMQSVETLGCTTVIASDKTGTLTQNRMTVQHCWYDDELRDVPAPKNMPEFKRMMGDSEKRGAQGWRVYEPSNPTFKLLQRVATLCNNSDFVIQDKFDPNAGLLDLEKEVEKDDFNLLNLQCTGDASESGLIKCVQLLRDVKKYRVQYPKIFEIKFNSTNKWQLSVHDMAADGSDVPQIMMKGAPEKVILRCSKIMINGREQPLTEEIKAHFLTAYETMGGLGERVLGFAVRSLEGFNKSYPFNDQPSPNFPVDDMTFVGMFSMIDPPRDGVPEAVDKCNRASVKVFMVTGDHPITARAIAKQVGIINEEAVQNGTATVCTGDDIREIMEIQDEAARNEAWDKVLRHEQIVFARVTPAHKLLIVENNQRWKRVVAVTGDGVNDAPALKKADIGVAMGIAGKDVTKEAADMILMDDNFASIVNGVEQGRLIFDNLKKSIMYTLTSKVPELSPFILWVTVGMPLATTTILILCIDLGTDMMPAISFAYETAEADIMNRPPRNAHSDHLVDLKLLLFTYLHIGVMQALAGWFGYIVALNDYGYAPWTLMGNGFSWSKNPLLCNQNSDGYSSKCAFGCNEWGGQRSQLASLVGNYTSLSGYADNYCKEGCTIPTAGAAWDPFIEFTPDGFRGFTAGVEATCGRTCAWYQGLGAAKVAEYLAASRDPNSPLRYILTEQDKSAFDSLCDLAGSTFFGFRGRGQADKGRMEAEIGSKYWWDGMLQSVPNLRYQRNVLAQAQTAYFCAVVWNKIIAALISKTRKLSLFQHGVFNNHFMLYAFVFEICIVILLSYVPPLNSVFGTGPLHGLHWLPGFAWVFLCFGYDETRKWAMRRWPGGWVERLTYW